MREKRRINAFHGFGTLLALSALALVLATGSPSAQTERADPLSRLIEAARQEGVIEFEGPVSLTPAGAQALIAALNKKYNLNLKLNYVPSTNYPVVAAQIITEIQAGQPPTYDVVYLTEFYLAKLYSRGFLIPFDWTRTFSHITKDSVYFETGGILIGTIFALPAYNTKLVPPQDVPKRWEDLLDPKWKGKMLAPNNVDSWITLSQIWGEEKTVAFLQRLKAQEPVYGRYPEMNNRLPAGEYLLAATQLTFFVDMAKQRGVPIDYADQVKPAPVLFDMMGIPKGARHANAAKLFVAFSLSPEGQEIWHRFAQRSSLFIPGTPAWKFSQGKELLFRDMKALVQNPESFEQLETKFARLLGLR